VTGRHRSTDPDPGREDNALIVGALVAWLAAIAGWVVVDLVGRWT
jgi:hypothetical protein